MPILCYIITMVFAEYFDRSNGSSREIKKANNSSDGGAAEVRKHSNQKRVRVRSANSIIDQCDDNIAIDGMRLVNNMSSKTVATVVDPSNNSSPSLAYTHGGPSDSSDDPPSNDSQDHPQRIQENSESKSKDSPPNDSDLSKLFSAFQTFRKFAGKVVNNPNVQICIIILIALNAVLMGLATFDFVTDSEKVNEGFEKADQAFLIVFTIELFLQFVYLGKGLFRDSWLIFDLCIVVVSWSFESFQIVRAFRVFRAFRLVTRVKTLQNLVLAIFHVAPSMAAIIALLVLILYIYGVMCTELFRDTFRDGITSEDYFSSFDKTLFTLFGMLTMEWADIAREVMEEYAWSAVIFASFIVITGFILYSLVIAVICDAVAVTEQSHERRGTENLASQQLRIRALHRKVNELNKSHRETLKAVNEALEGLRLPVEIRHLSTGHAGSQRITLTTSPDDGEPEEAAKASKASKAKTGKTNDPYTDRDKKRQQLRAALSGRYFQ